jgi:uncharacterized protein (TIGR00255 family)
MTGFCRVEGACGPWTFAVEARSVNGRNLEVRFRGPQGYDGLERLAREAAQARFARGQLQVNVQARRAETALAPRINRALLEEYVTLAGEFDGRPGVAPARIDGLLALRGVIEAGAEDEGEEERAALEAAIGRTINEALDGLRAARLAEGEALKRVLEGLVDQIETLKVSAETEAAGQSGAIRERFERRLAELIADPRPLEERIVQEAAILAGKADVREELDRLAAHIDQARALLSGGGAAGRRIDFLTQEFIRETNTLCSKSATTALTAVGLELKAVIEQFREQVQNVE